VKLKVPEIEGVPLISPDCKSRTIPAGSAPAVTDQLYGGLPSVATSDCSYLNPTVPSPNGDPVVIVGGGVELLPVISMANALLDVTLALSVTCALKEYTARVVGVPLMAPVDEASVSPGGSVPELIDQLYGGVPPEAARTWE
jgi:hypothetical protein